jgi:hypothetical protein
MRQHVFRLSFERVVFFVAVLVLAVGIRAPTAQYLSPQTGLGYALGIIGGSMMLLLIVYPLRKRIKALRFFGTVPHWFRLHMMLGIAGPICILYHSNFSLGATNSNVALFSMLIVSGSGIVGRYFYSKIHHGLYGRRATLSELQARANALRGGETQLPMLPELMSRIEREERRFLDAGSGALLAPVAPFILAARARGARRRRYVRDAVRAAARTDRVIAAQSERILNVAAHYAERRVQASRQVAEFRVYERLFSLWHVLHLPLFFMLLAAGIVHVIAVHVY